MTAKQKIKKLSHGWYGYAVCATLVSILGLRTSGILAFAVGLTLWAAINAIFLAISLAIVAFLSRRLLARSSLTRLFLIGASGLCVVLGTLSALGGAWSFLHMGSLALVWQLVLTGVGVFMNVRSFKVLTDPDVKAYCA